jgi:hypothetical protein
MSIQQEREITIYATRSGQIKKISTAVTTWGELQPLVKREGYDLSSLLAAENINKSDLVNDLAVLPATAFRLFLRPKQTKSGGKDKGGIDRKTCFSLIKAHITLYPEDKKKFIIDGKNMTQLPTNTVQKLVAKYCKISKGEVTEVAPVEEKTSETPKVVATLETVSSSDLTDVERVEEAINLISTLCDCESHSKANKHLNKLLEEIQVCVGPDEELEKVETEEEAIKREAKEMGY